MHRILFPEGDGGHAPRPCSPISSRPGDACIRLELSQQHSANPRRTTDAVGFIVVEPMILGLYTCYEVSPSAVATTVESALVLLVVILVHAQVRGCGTERQVEDFWPAI